MGAAPLLEQPPAEMPPVTESAKRPADGVRAGPDCACVAVSGLLSERTKTVTLTTESRPRRPDTLRLHTGATETPASTAEMRSGASGSTGGRQVESEGVTSSPEGAGSDSVLGGGSGPHASRPRGRGLCPLVLPVVSVLTGTPTPLSPGNLCRKHFFKSCFFLLLYFGMLHSPDFLD